MQLREAEPGEGRLIAEELWYPLAREMTGYSELNELADGAREHAVEGFEEMLGSDERVIFLAAVDGTEVGFANVKLGERPAMEHGSYAEVTDLYVTEGHRGQGYGSRLLDRAEQLAAEEECDFVQISAEWDNDGARSLYAAHGYDPKQVTFTKRVK